MPLTLSQILVARGVPPDRLAEAEERRAKLGGGLETSLLELNVLTPERIAELWGEVSQLPRAPTQLVADVTVETAQLLPKELAARHGMVPLGLHRRQLSLLARHPVDLATIDELSFLLSRPLRLFVGTELEVGELLERIYGIELPQRLRDLRDRLATGEPLAAEASSNPAAEVDRSFTPPARPAAREEAMRSAPPTGSAEPAPSMAVLADPVFNPQAASAGEVAFWREAGALLSRASPAPASASPDSDHGEKSPFEGQPLGRDEPGTPGRAASSGETLAALREETTREGIMRVTMDFLRGAFDCVVLLVRRGEAFRAFEVVGAEVAPADLSLCTVDLARSHVLQTLVDGRAPYVGSVPPGDPLEDALAILGRSRLRAVLLYPIVVRDRTVAVIHGDRGGAALAPRQLSDVALVLSQVGAQLERALHERRRTGGRPMAPTPSRVPVAAAKASGADVEAPKTSGIQLAPPAGSATPAPSAEAASDDGTFEMPVDWMVEEDAGYPEQVRAFLSGDPAARLRAGEVLRAGGVESAAAIAERFPGPLFVFRMSIDELPAPPSLGPLLGLLADLGSSAVPALAELAESASDERRFWATVVLAKMGERSAIPTLARRLLDPTPDVALAARRGLWRLRSAPEFEQVLEVLTEQLSASDPARLVVVIRTLGQFHHLPAIPRLLSFVGIRDAHVSGAAAEALREISRQDFGVSEKRWQAWWQAAASKPRTAWLIEALENRDRDLRLSAISELTEATGLDFGFHSDLPPVDLASAAARWREWWEREGRDRMGLGPG